MPTPATTEPATADEDAAILAEVSGMRRGGGGGGSRDPDPDPGEVLPGARKDAGDGVEPGAEGSGGDAGQPPARTKPDPDTERRQATLQAQEKRQRLALQAEQRKLEERAAELAQQAERFGKLEDIVRRANDDPGALLELLRAANIGEDRYELIARDLYAASPEGRKKPELREASQRALRERTQRDDVAALRKELKELRDDLKQQQAQAEADRRGAETMASYIKVAKCTDKAPLFNELYSRKPDKAEAVLAGIAAKLIEETGEIPDADDVLATYERIRREDLEDQGISVADFLKGKQKPQKTESKAAGETPTARTIGNDLGTSTKVRHPEAALSEDEEREQILAELLAKRRAEGLG